MAYKMEGGIYSITCLFNNRKYIGLTRSFTEREYHHFNSLNKNSHRNDFLQRSYKKHGRENFLFEIIEIIKDSDKMVEREMYWIKKFDTFKNGFNLTIGGEYWIPTEYTRNKRSKSLKGENNPMYGRVGEKNSNAKLTDKQVVDIKTMLNEGFVDKEICLKHNLTRSQFQKIKHNRTWKHIIV